MPHACARHPDTPGTNHCLKYNRYLCEDCLCCQDPELYCKSRTMCVIWEVSREQRRDRGSDAGDT